MIKVYGMKSCPDCSFVEKQIACNDAFQVIDIGEDVRNMKAFIRLRDTDPVFDEVKKSGSIGIPCFVKEDGSVTLSPEEVGLKTRETGNACRIDGSGC